MISNPEGHSMDAPSSKIVDDVLSLPTDQRLVLVNRILESLNVPTQPEIAALWAEEAERRIEQIEMGQVKPIPGEDVFKETRERLRK
jgi:putative addiction module component (TIGR02574 family)